MKRTILFFLFLTVGALYADRTVMVNESGEVTVPANFFSSNPVSWANISNKPTTASELGIPDVETVGPYMIVKIDVPSGQSWTDFELKISRTNFDTNTEDMLFFYHSPEPRKTHFAYHIWTNKPDVYYTSSGHVGNPNRRTWLKQGDTSIFAALEDAHAEVGGFVIVVKDDLREWRGNLVISYNLINATNSDNDTLGRSIWRPEWPRGWVYSFDPSGWNP